MNQNRHKDGSGKASALKDLLQDRRNLLVLGVGLVAILVIVGVIVAVWPGANADAESGNSWSEPADDKDYDAKAGVLDKNAFDGTVLPETKNAGREYLDETLFLGDSNTYRYMMYGDEKGKAFTTVDNTIGVVSMGAGAITTEKCMGFEGMSGLVTMPEAVKIMQPRRIIIGFGTNNLSAKTETFIEQYSKGLKAIHEAYPYADIIVNAVPPLDKQRENTRLNMKQVDSFNAAIAEMCKQNDWYFLDSSEALKDPETGWAKKDYTLGDGVHLSKDGVTALFDYICTHALENEDTRPKPLKKVPKAKGVPPGLIQDDPIAVRGAKVPVNFVVSGSGHLEGSTNQMVKKGSTCSAVTAVPDEGWTFAGWQASIGSVGGDATVSFTVPGNADANGVVVTAVFTEGGGEEEHSHDWRETNRQEPTCGTDGYVEYACDCGETKRESIAATGAHNYVKGVCTVCGAKDSSYSAPTPTPTPAPTPTPTPAPPAHEHSWTKEHKDPTCTEAGYDREVCSCGAVQNETALPALGHQFGSNPTCDRCPEPNPNYTAPTQAPEPPAPASSAAADQSDAAA